MQDVLDRTRVKKGGIHAFVELHIEQGPMLEKAREELGLVTAIAAVRGILTSHGDSPHFCASSGRAPSITYAYDDCLACFTACSPARSIMSMSCSQHTVQWRHCSSSCCCALCSRRR